MAVDIHQLFNEMLPAQLKNHAEAAKQIGGKFQINVTGDGGGEWFIDASDSGPSAKAGNPGGADLTITMAIEDFHKLMENPQANGLQLFFAGKMKLDGNQMLGMKLNKLFTLGQ